MNCRRLSPFQYIFFASCSLIFSAKSLAASTELPDLGDSASSYVSLQEEHELGRLWLRQLRRQAPTIDMPLATEFLENLIFRLVPHSEVKQSSFEFVIVDQPQLNAFAVPGGIIGINFGLLLYARDEDELSAVLAHELAHLSQRHFARQIEQAERQQPLAIATILASILLIATNNPTAGFAGLMTTQATSIQNRLAYSRKWEREADRIGMKSLVSAGLDPNAMSSMFGAMLQANRYSNRPPEFLLTHPITESRIADAEGRAANFPRKSRLISFDFQLLKHMAMLRYRIKSKEQTAYFESQLTKYPENSLNHAASQMSLALLAADNGKSKKGLDILDSIKPPWNEHPAYITLKARLLSQRKNFKEARNLLNNALLLAPDSYQLKMSKAQTLIDQEKFSKAVSILKKLSEKKPASLVIWRKLADAAGASQQTVLSHRANGEYLFFSGQMAKALRQMDLALKEARHKKDFQQEAAISRRLRIMASSPSSFK